MLWTFYLGNIAFARDFTPEMMAKDSFTIEVNFQQDGPQLYSTPILFHYGVTDWFEFQIESNGMQVGSAGTEHLGTSFNGIVKLFDGHDWLPATALLLSAMPSIGKSPSGGYSMLLIDWELTDNLLISIHPTINKYTDTTWGFANYTGFAFTHGEKHPLSFYLGGGVEGTVESDLLYPLITETVIGWDEHWEFGFYTMSYFAQQPVQNILTAGVNYHYEW